ncbi:hypothetical protein SGL43_07185 [Streptomyces globisporus]|uniref:Uncharacterized protein n=1 Tax=Streptomyces globisporus TaxID=1908 RepID=A0ABM9H8W4_STRGL|nr:hypothetical protein SGL43_07185 [Streptomyces globisporus]
MHHQHDEARLRLPGGTAPGAPNTAEETAEEAARPSGPDRHTRPEIP